MTMDDDLAKTKGLIRDPMAVTWTEQYSETIDKYWNKLPKFVSSALATMAVFLMGVTVNGEWVLMLVHFIRSLTLDENEMLGENQSGVNATLGIRMPKLEFKMDGYLPVWLGSAAVSYIMYFGIGGFLHWYFYVRQRDKAHEWKCQPNTWLPADLERHEIYLGSFCLILGSTLSAFFATHIMNGGWSMVYYRFSDYPWYWTILQWPAIFIYQDYLTYWHHRIYHTPFLYKNFHKLHHKYKQPTAFSVTAIHPVEFVHMQLMLSSPMFLFPIHWIPYSVIAMYTYYHGIIDHSGINFKAYWWQPWQPDAIFHDNHHQYFHVNFSFNCSLWDKIHGTYRRKDRIYHEDIYYGRGKDIREASVQEVAEDLHQRTTENPLAFRGNKREFDLSEDDVAKLKVH
ncbi:Hypothetical predicted protein [Cloeon dipterum]|nr:Hypothetical predicted protein [Cloeon dipterum]